ncbi:MAG TPA: bifunctional methylenetetrahydrofolate dehydrogenase/methenyltetrahydrofolate cyclohydrolase FolD [Limnochordia bacterium]
MLATILDGRATAEAIHAEVAERAKAVTARRGFPPGLGLILVGEDPASVAYVRSKGRVCARLGLYSQERRFPQEATAEEIVACIEAWNAAPEIDGILVQLPLPAGIDTAAVLAAIDPQKDVDGLHPHNAGCLVLGQEGMIPCTPAGILELLHRYRVPIAGRRAVVVGRSILVGKPVAMLLLQQDATVTLCHSRTPDVAAVCREAEILVAAAGRPHLIQGEWVRRGAAVIDVGITRVDGKLVGDVDFEAAQAVAGWITPVPGGVGPMTVAMLMSNTVRAAERRLPPA